MSFVTDNDGFVQRSASHKGQRDDLDNVQLHELSHLREFQHVFEGVEQRAQIGVDLGLQVAGQKAEFLAGLDGRTGKDDSTDLVFLEHGNRDGHGQIRLARSRRPDAEGQVIGQHRLDIFRLPLGGRLDELLVRENSQRLVGIERRILVPVPDEGGYVRGGEGAVLEKLLLHLADDFGGFIDVLFLACDDQLVLAGGDFDAERLPQETKVAVGRAEQFELVVGRIQLYGNVQRCPLL